MARRLSTMERAQVIAQKQESGEVTGLKKRIADRYYTIRIDRESHIKVALLAWLKGSLHQPELFDELMDKEWTRYSKAEREMAEARLGKWPQGE